MPALPENGYIQLVRITDELGNPARVSQIAGVYRLAVDAILGGANPVVSAAFDVGAVDEASVGMYVRAGLTGYDSSAALASRNIPIEARDFNLNVDVAKTLVGMVVNARNAIYNHTSTDWSVWSGDSPSDVSGSTATGPVAAYTNAMGVGIDNTGAPVRLRAIESRQVGATPVDERFYGLSTLAHLRAINVLAAVGAQDVALNAGSASAAQDEALMRLLCRCAMAGLDSSLAVGVRSVAIAARNVNASPIDERFPGFYANAFVRGLDSTLAVGSRGVAVGARGAVSASASAAEQAYALLVEESRESGFATAQRGKRFYITNQSMYSYGTLLTAQTAFVTTTPTLLCRVDSSAIRVIVRSINLSIGNTPGGVVYIAVHLDTVDRYSSGGVSPIPSNTNEESTTTAVSKWYSNPITTAVQATTRPLASAVAPATPGTSIQISFADGVLLGPSHASLLVYVWSATTAPQILYNAEIGEVA
jgi:hypothetical protein